jgi:hypothetical protein
MSVVKRNPYFLAWLVLLLAVSSVQAQHTHQFYDASVSLGSGALEQAPHAEPMSQTKGVKDALIRDILIDLGRR